MPKGSGLAPDVAIPRLTEALAYYDQADVERWFARSMRLTGHYPTIYDPSTIEDVRTFKRVPNEPFRKAFLSATQPLVLGEPGFPSGKGPKGEPEWIAGFRDELATVLALPEGVDSPTTKIGPYDLSASRIGGYVRSALGVSTRKENGVISVAWTVQYEIAEVIAKVFGLTPVTCGI